MEELNLESGLSQAIEDMWFAAGKMVYNEQYDEAKDLMLHAWEKLPEPKANYSPSYWVSRHLAEALIGLREFDLAEKWLATHKSALFRIDSGERDFLEGKFHYAQGAMEKAKRCFEIANQKSSGRLFKAEKAKSFKELISKEQLRPTELSELFSVSQAEIQKQNYPYALSLLYDAFNIDQMNSTIHFNKGLCHFELKEFDRAADAFTRAYMLDGEAIFKAKDSKYFEFLKTKIEI